MSSSSELMVYLIVYGIFFLASFFLAIIPSKIAKKKGYSGVGFYFFGLFALVPAIIVASVLRNKNTAPQQPQYQQYQQPPQYPPQG